MSLTFWVFQNASNGPNSQPHRVIPDQDGNLSAEDIARLKSFNGKGFVGTIEATDIHEARKQLKCPACEAGLEIIREFGH